MSTYGSGRDGEYARRLDNAISDFISRYNANPSTDHKTIILFPGGMGSQLMRARAPYQNGPPFSYDMAWLDCTIASGAATKLQMQGDFDYQQHYIVPDRCVDFLLLRPYSEFIQWCQDNWLDLFIFGWDWRLGIEHTADFFLTTFMPKFDTRVSGCTPNPLQNFTLIGHSFGGMVVKLILNQTNSQYVQQMRRAISVATQFYGYGGQVHRFFKGDPDLNWTEGLNGATAITEIVSTLPAGYELLFLDKATYNTNKIALANDPHGYNLLNYPSMDATNPGQRADPYNPIPGKPGPGSTGDVRYISNHGFDWNLLAAGGAVYQQVAKKLNHNVAKKFYNIRGVQFKNRKVVKGTVVSQTWQRVPATFDPDNDPDPLSDTLGPGDGVLPAWSTRLIGVPDQNVNTIKADIEHMTMMNEGLVQKKIANLLGLAPKTLKPMRVRAKTTAASRAELNNFLGGLRAVALKKGLQREERRTAVHNYLRRFGPDQLQEFLGRAYLDALKSPSQKMGRLPGKKRGGATKKPKDLSAE
jgi:pimeloyl-ACP methyl ester carboxylesterase